MNQEKYNVIYTEDTVNDFEIDEKEIKITYEFNIVNDEISLYCGSTKKLDIEIKTTPSGYEDVLKNKSINWNSGDTSIANVDENGIVKGLKTGNTKITAEWIDKQDSVDVKVIPSRTVWIAIIWGLIIGLLAVIILTIFGLIIV